MKKYAWIIALAVLTIFIMVLSLTNTINQAIGMDVALLLMIAFNVIIAVYAFKKDAKAVTWIMGIFAVIGAVLLVINTVLYIKSSKEDGFKFQVTIEPGENEKTSLFAYDNHEYYVNGIKGVNIEMKDGKKYNLKDAIEGKVVTLDEILDLMVPDTGTVNYKLYYDEGQEEYKNDSYSVLVCENETHDVIFGAYDYTYDDLCTKK